MSKSRRANDLSLIYSVASWARRLQGILAGVESAAFHDDEILQLAVSKCLEMIGEQSKRLSSDFKSRYSEVDWEYLRRQRNILAHEYEDYEIADLFGTAQELIGLAAAFGQMLSDMEETGQ